MTPIAPMTWHRNRCHRCNRWSGRGRASWLDLHGDRALDELRDGGLLGVLALGLGLLALGADAGRRQVGALVAATRAVLAVVPAGRGRLVLVAQRVDVE